MNFMLWLILVSSVCSNPSSESAWERTVRDSLPGDEEVVQKENMMDILGVLMSKTERPRGVRNRGRERLLIKRQREGRQIEDADGNVIEEEQCTITGFEKEIKEECEEKSETECKMIQVAKERMMEE